MQQFTTTQDFTYRGQSLPGLSLLINNEGEPVLPANRFLLHLELEQGKVHSPKTILNYSNSMYDYFSFLEAQNLSWDDPPRWTDVGYEVTNLSLYQNWCHKTYRKDNGKELQHSTINVRVGHIETFYRWARDKAKLIDWVPFVTVLKEVSQKGLPDAMVHTREGSHLVERSENRLPVMKEPLLVLTLAECWELKLAPMSDTIQNVTSLLLCTGIRNEECRTFPKKYIFDPVNLSKNRRIRIFLNKNDMKTKGNKSRYIFVSWNLMNVLHQYTKFGEGVIRARKYEKAYGVEPQLLFLNDSGRPFSERGLNNAFAKLCKGYTKRGKITPPVLPFQVHPHKLRHTFATMELYYESEKLDKNGRKKGITHALNWIRKRLGHNHLQSVMRYIHCLEIFDDSELNAYQQELDDMILRGADATK